MLSSVKRVSGKLSEKAAARKWLFGWEAINWVLISLYFLDYKTTQICQRKKSQMQSKKYKFSPTPPKSQFPHHADPSPSCFFPLAHYWMPFRVSAVGYPGDEQLVCLSDRPPVAAVLKLFYLRTSSHSWGLWRTPNELLFLQAVSPTLTVLEIQTEKLLIIY